MLDQRDHPHTVQHITTLPQPLIEKILISGTRTEDKKALRQTCKQFQQILDNNLVCIKLRMDHDMKQKRVMKRFMQHFPALTAVDFAATHNLCSLLEYMPTHITMLRLHAKSIDVKELARLPRLTTLYLESSSLLNRQGMIAGIGYISGLTRLHCDKPIDSLAHLAPTLKHLSIWDCKHVTDMNQLTNLEALKVAQNLPADFFHANKQLPLQHLNLVNCFEETKSTDWQAAPTTLTCLSFRGKYKPLPAKLPSTVTHLQILDAKSRDVEQAVAALPGLRRLDLHLDLSWAKYDGALDHLSQLRDMNLLYVSMYTDSNGYRPLWRISQKAPELGMVQTRGVHVHVIENDDDMVDLFGLGHPPTDTAWATPP